MSKLRLVAALVAIAFLSACTLAPKGLQQKDPAACAAAGAALLGGGAMAAGAATANGRTARALGIGVGGAALGAGLGYMICKSMQEEPEPPAPPPPPAPAPPPPPPPPPPQAAPEPEGPDPCEVRVAFGGVNFDFNKATIRPEAGPVLDKWADRLKTCPNVALQIEGHTDSVGPEEYNQGLSERRANSVRDFMVAAGIDASRLNAVGYGETRPVASNSTRDGRAENRRVEIIAQ